MVRKPVECSIVCVFCLDVCVVCVYVVCVYVVCVCVVCVYVVCVRAVCRCVGVWGKYKPVKSVKLLINNIINDALIRLA